MRMKKTVGYLLVLCMIVSLFAGCANQDGDTPGSNDTPRIEDQASKENDVSNEVSQEKPVLKELMSYTPTDPNEEPPAKKIEELTGYKVEYFTMPAENADEKLNLDISTGVEYDFMKLTVNQFSTLVGKGALISIDDLLDEQALNLKNSFTDEEWQTGVYDGKIYGIPQFDARYVGGGIGYRKDITDELGLTAPTDLDGFYEFLKAIKTEKPDMIPLTGSGGLQAGIASAFGLTTNAWVVNDGSITHRIFLPETREYLQFMTKLYNEELIDDEWPINKVENIDQKFTSGKAFANWRGWWDANTINSAVAEITGGTVEYILPLKNEEGKAAYGLNIGSTGFVAIPKSCKDPVEVMKYLNLRSDPDILKTSFLGEEGVHHEVREDENGESYWPIFPAFEQWFNGHYYNVTIPSGVFTTLWLCRVRKNPVVYEVFDKMNQLEKEAFVNDPMSYAPPLPAVSKYTQSLGKMEEDFYISVITGTKNIDDDFDTFIKNWQREGGDEMLKEVEAWYNNK